MTLSSMKLLAFLVLITLFTLLSHRLGYFDTAYALYSGLSDEPIESVIVGDAVGSLSKDGAHSKVTCHLDVIEKFNLCGMALPLGSSDRINGFDVSAYNSVDIHVAYKTPIENGKLKVTFRNHNPNYSTSSDEISQKFNSVSFNPSNFSESILVPLNVFQVDRWWLEQYRIDFKDSLTELTNVVRVEFLTYKMSKVGRYEITIKSVILRGKLISEYSLFKCIAVIWLIAGILLLLRQRHNLKDMSKIDPLTGLYNQIGIRNKIKKINEDKRVYVFYTSMSDIKKINDTYGHNIGDRSLVEFGEIIKEKISNFDTKGHFCRFAGDEFVIVFEGLPKEKMNAIASSICSGKQYNIDIFNHNISITINLGVASSFNVNKQFDTLISHASAAMYHVKKNNLPHFQEFDEDFSQSVYFKKRVSEYLKKALEDNDFHLEYMPIYDAESLEVSAFEVLIRTASKNLKGIGPDIFIPIAEQFNLIKDIDAWVIENTFKCIKENDNILINKEMKFCINISSDQLKNTDFVDFLKKMLKVYSIQPERIGLELTETSLVSTEQKSIDVLNCVRDLGVHISLDDYGTGYISFNQLVNYPVDSLKIDKSFVDLLETQKEGAEAQDPGIIVRSIQSLAKSYKLSTVAEGVETVEQYRYLSDLGCQYVQGYLFSKPLAWSTAKELLISPVTEELKNKVLQ